MEPPPAAVNGVIDLRGWDFEKKGSVELKGFWKFLPNGDDIGFSDVNIDDASWLNLKVPGYWNDATGRGDGFGCYRLRVLVDEEFWKTKPCLYVKGANTSYELYVNRTQLMNAGVFGTSPASAVPSLMPKVASIPKQESANEIIIALKVANFFHRGGGLNKPIVLGTDQQIQRMLWRMDFLSTLTLGFILMMAMYHLVLWLKRREDFASLWFSVFCFIIFIHTLAIDNYFERLFPDVNIYEFRFKVEYVTLALSWVAFAFFINRLFPQEVGKKFLLALFIAGFFLAVLPLATYARFFSRFVMMYNILLVGAGTWTVITMIVASIKKRNDAIFVLFGFVFLMLTVVNDILHNHHVIQTFFMSQFGLGGFLFFQSVVLSVRFARAYKTAEYLSQSLNAEVQIKTEELRLQTQNAIAAKEEIENSMKKIEALNERMTKELALAKRVHDQIVPKGVIISKFMQIHVESRPYMAVGGDYFDFVHLTENRTRIFLADTMGHGVSASLMTMLIKSEYDKVKFAAENPADIFKRMNDFFADNYKSLRTFFTGIIVDVDGENNQLTFASAGHHEQFFITQNKLLKFERTGRAVGISRDSIYDVIKSRYHAGDKLFLFTDGVFEEFNLNKEEFGIDRLEKFITGQISADGKMLVEELMRMVDGFISEEHLNDDLTFIAVDFY